MCLCNVMQAEVSELAHYEPMGVVDHPHPGQDFDDEVPATLSGKRGKDRSKGGPIFSYLTDTVTSLWIFFREFNMDVFIIYKFCVFNVGHTVEIRAEYFALVCAPCLEHLSDETRMRPLGTCTSKGHVKVLTV